MRKLQKVNQKNSQNGETLLISNIIAIGVNHSLAVLHESLNLPFQAVFIQTPRLMQRGLPDLIVAAELPLREVGLQPSEKKTVAQVEVRAVGALKDQLNSARLHVLLHGLGHMRSCIVPLPHDFGQMNWL